MAITIRDLDQHYFMIEELKALTNSNVTTKALIKGGYLAVDLGIKKRRLYEIVKFYRVYPIVRSLTAQLSWTHYVSLIDISDEKERLVAHCKELGITVSDFVRQIIFEVEE